MLAMGAIMLLGLYQQFFARDRRAVTLDAVGARAVIADREVRSARPAPFPPSRPRFSRSRLPEMVGRSHLALFLFRFGSAWPRSSTLALLVLIGTLRNSSVPSGSPDHPPAGAARRPPGTAGTSSRSLPLHGDDDPARDRHRHRRIINRAPGIWHRDRPSVGGDDPRVSCATRRRRQHMRPAAPPDAANWRPG